MSSTVRALLAALAAALAAFAALNPVDVPSWVMAIVAALAAGLAAIGILPPQWQITYKADTHKLARRGKHPAGRVRASSGESVHHKPRTTALHGRVRKTAAISVATVVTTAATLAVLLVLIGSGFLGAMPVASASAYQHLANTETQCYRDTQADAYANLGFINNYYALTYTRYSDTDVYVQFGYFQYHQGFAYERRYDCRYVGNDSANGGVYYSFIYVRNVAGTEVIYG